MLRTTGRAQVLSTRRAATSRNGVNDHRLVVIVIVMVIVGDVVVWRTLLRRQR
jgi:hypothetical protein